jgi:membrane peptidoglycan carboxypeptidase
MSRPCCAQAINRGTGRNAAMLPIANFGKTGTTQDYRDALFVGYAGDLVVGVWIGNDDNTPLKASPAAARRRASGAISCAWASVPVPRVPPLDGASSRSM